MPLLALLLLTGCDSQGWCERFNLACELPESEALPDLVDEDGDIWEAGPDCDDTDPEIHPSAEEVCDGVDNNCDGVVDEGTPGVRTWSYDADGDGYGTDVNTIDSCDQPPGFALQDGDCDDDDVRVNPGARDVCGDGRDNDCDGLAPPECYLAGELLWTEGELRLSSEGVSGRGIGSSLADGVDPAAPRDLAVVMGSPDHDEARGAAWLTGPTERLLTATGAWTVSSFTRSSSGTRPDQRAGTAVALPGDTDGDGTAELAVGLPGAQRGRGPEAPRTGAVYLLRGPDVSRDNPLPIDLVIAGTDVGDEVGGVLAGVPDLRGDGVAGLLVGAPAAVDGRGRAALFTGGATGEQELADGWWVLTGGQAGDALGAALDGGDLDGDGIGDLVVGAPAAAADQVLVFLGPLEPGVTAPERATAALDGDPDSAPGAAVTIARDLDGDGHAELLVGAPERDTAAGEDAGTAWIVAGGRGLRGGDLEDRAWAVLEGGEAGALLGATLTRGGHLDDDGVPDLVLGAPGTDRPDGPEVDVGAAWILRGVPAGTTVLAADDVDDLGARILGTAQGGRAGAALLVHPDIDGNGLDEILVGLPENGQGTVVLFRPLGW